MWDWVFLLIGGVVFGMVFVKILLVNLLILVFGLFVFVFVV